MKKSDRVVIVGGGWAGMAAALELSQHNIPVSVFESAPTFGGRARTVMLDGHAFDNGQHLLIGAYHETLRLLTGMGTDATTLLARLPLRLEVHGELRLVSGPLPAPLHLVWGLLSAKGMRISDRYRAIRMSLALALSGYRLAEDISVAELLARHRQSPWLLRNLWEPLCLATLNTPLHQASAQVFLRVLQESFSRRRHDADLLIPKVPLGELFCDNAARHLQINRENQLQLRSKVSGITTENGYVTGITVNGESLHTDTLILATGPAATSHLLQQLPETASLAGAISKLGAQPIATVYLHYPDTELPFPMLGLSGTLSQWVFDRAVCNQPGWYAVVISAKGEHSAWDKAELVRHVQQELAERLPRWPAQAAEWHVIREKRATFDCTVGVDSRRPGNAMPLKGLWLAGDYTNTGYPATLEGAVRSGVECAHRIIAARRGQQ